MGEKEIPKGCLGCNHDAIAAFIRAHGLDPEEFEEVPNPKQAWGEVAVCGKCQRAWLIPRRRDREAN